jgi:hypothetical protein
MDAGPVTAKLGYLCDCLLAWADDGHLTTAADLRQAAAVIASVLPCVAALEEKAVPQRFRVVQGGAA